MTDNSTAFDPDDDRDDNEDFRNLRTKAKKFDEVAGERDSLKRENAFLRAGIPIEDPRMAYFVKGYDGDLEPSAIRQAAIDAGFMQAPTPPADPALDQAREGQQRALAASSGTEPIDDPMGVQVGMEEALAQGGLEGLSAFTQQYGVTFQTPEI